MGSSDQGNSTCAGKARFNKSAQESAIPQPPRQGGKVLGPVLRVTQREDRP
jgi:hypothetical protein